MAMWDFLGTTGGAGFGGGQSYGGLDDVVQKMAFTPTESPWGSGPFDTIQALSGDADLIPNAATNNWLEKMFRGGKEILNDPNTYATLGEFAQNLGSGMDGGAAAGAAGASNIRRQAMQRAGSQLAEGQQGLVQEIIAALSGDPTGSSLLGPLEDVNTLNSVTMTNDGFTLKGPNPGKTKPSYEDTQKDLESITGMGADADWYKSGGSPF